MDSEPNSPSFTGDELLVMRGQEAEAFMRFIGEGEKYFTALLAAMKDDLQREIMDLSPADTDRFTVLKAKVDCLYDPLTRVWSDIEIGKRAKQRIDGEIPTDREGMDLL